MQFYQSANYNQSSVKNLKYLAKVDHITGKTLWAYFYGFTYHTLFYNLGLNVLTNQNIWITIKYK